MNISAFRYFAALGRAGDALDRAADQHTDIDTAHAEVAIADAAVRLATEIRAGLTAGLSDTTPSDDDPPLSPSFPSLTPDEAAARPTDFTEQGRGGPCPIPGCKTDGSHLHRAWELTEAQGRLTPEAASEWNHDTWLLFIHAHGIQQSEALDAVRSRAEAAGWAKPWSLAALDGRPQLCEVLLDLARERKMS